MITFFNFKIKETNDFMREELQREVIPYLKGQGWRGNGYQLRRRCGEDFQTLEFQFNKWGKSLAVNLDLVEPDIDFDKTRFTKLKSVRSQRLGTRAKRIKKSGNMDHWFRFIRGFIVYFINYKGASSQIHKMYNEEAELIFKDMRESIK